MVVGGRWTGWGRALAHTRAYGRVYFISGLMTVILAPFVIVSMPVVLPAALCVHLLLVRVFPKVSWNREPRRASVAAGAGFFLVMAGSLAWLASGDRTPEFVDRIGPWGPTIYVLGVPVLFSNLGILIGYLIRMPKPR
jgi:hypothetical protein